jgi:hypothetical protein
VFLLILLTGCKEGSAASASPEQTVSASPGNQMKIITIYSIEPDTLELVPVYVKKENKKKSPEYIVALVKNNLSAYDIKIPALKKKGKNLYVSFSAEGEPVKNCNKKVEKLILECFANSLLDNIKSCENIILQIDGNAYESDNFKFGKEEVYASR